MQRTDMVSVRSGLNAENAAQCKLNPSELKEIIRGAEPDVVRPHVHTHVQLAVSDPKLMKNGARVVALRWLVVVLRIPDRHDRLPRAWVSLELIDDVCVLAVCAEAIRSVKDAVVFGVVLELRADGDHEFRHAYSAKKLARLNSTDSWNRSASDAERQRRVHVVDEDRRVLNLTGQHSSWGNLGSVSQHVTHKIDVAVDSVLDMNLSYGSIQLTYLSSVPYA